MKAHPDTTPTIAEVETQIRDIHEKYQFDAYFMATDSTPEEITELRTALPVGVKLVLFDGKFEDFDELERSTIASESSNASGIIEQTIATASTHFVGCPSSTFSRTITELRDCGFLHKKPPPPKSTYNALCTKINKDCSLNHWDRYLEYPKHNPGKRV